MSAHPAPQGRALVRWTRPRLLAVAAAAALLTAAALAGAVLALMPAGSPGPRGAVSRPNPTPKSVAGSAGASLSARDALAAAPLPTVTPRDALPAALVDGGPVPLNLPGSAEVGAAGVQTGFPHTPTGALAQLAAIEQAAIESGSLPGARAVVTGWAAPSGPPDRPWSPVVDMGHLLTGLGLSAAGLPDLAIELDPAMGLVKGSAGADFTVVCVDSVLTVTLQRTARIAVADCQRMTWSVDRWLLDPGSTPAAAPAVWPGTARSFAVGYRELRRG